MQIRKTESILFSGNNKTVNDNKIFAMANKVKEDTSVKVSISKSGRARAQMLKDSVKKDEYMAGAESKIDRILDTIRGGGSLSKEEEELVNNELKNMSEQKYKEYKDLRLKPEDVMMELKENYMRRQKLFFEMQEQMEEDMKNQAGDFDAVKIMTYMQEKENDEKLIEMVKEYAESEDEDGVEEDAKPEEMSEEALSNPELNLSVGDTPVNETTLADATLQKTALKRMESIENQMDDVKAANKDSAKKENTFAKGLDEDYKRIQQVLYNDEFTVEDKVKAYDRFVSEARVNARGREVERIKKQFDAETIMLAKIMRLGQNQTNGEEDGLRGQFGAEFVKSFLV